jgi:hypothetical protein
MRIGIVLTLVLTFGLVGLANAQTSQVLHNFEIGPQVDVYGPGIHRSTTGQPYRWQPINQPKVRAVEPVKPNAYGLGIGMDAVGRPVRAVKD